MEPNRGARVRPIDEDFVRDIIEIAALIEPALTRWFVTIATEAMAFRPAFNERSSVSASLADLPARNSAHNGHR